MLILLIILLLLFAGGGWYAGPGVGYYGGGGLALVVLVILFFMFFPSLNPRTSGEHMAYLIAFVLASYVPPVVIYQDADTGMGKCKMDQHYHNSDQLCHRDGDDSPIHVLHIGS